MGPNGSGKSTLSHVLMGRGDYTVTDGSVTIDGEELLGRPTWARARLGLFLTHQYPVEVAGVRLRDLVLAATDGDGAAAARIDTEAARLAVRDEFLTRGVNVEFSGGEQKRAETLQLAVLRPRFAVLDEIDSGLDVDALRDVARRIEAMTNEDALGVLAITHYARLLTELRPDRVHVFHGRAGRHLGRSGAGRRARGGRVRRAREPARHRGPTVVVVPDAAEDDRSPIPASRTGERRPDQIGLLERICAGCPPNTYTGSPTWTSIG